MSESLTNANIPFKIVDNVDDARDPDDIYRSEGEKGLLEYLNNLVDGHEFTINYYRKHSKLRTIEERRGFIFKTMPHIVSLASKLEVDDYLNRVAEISGFSYNVLLDMYKAERKKIAKNEHFVSVHAKYPHRQVLNRLQQAERLLIEQMITHPQALDFYITKKVKFTDEFHRYIANFLSYNKEVDRQNIYAVILSDINQRIDDEQRQDFYKNNVIEIAETSDQNSKFRPELLEDAYQVVNKEGQENLINLQMEQELAQATNDLQRAKIVAKYRNGRKTNKK